MGERWVLTHLHRVLWKEPQEVGRALALSPAGSRNFQKLLLLVKPRED